MDNIKGFYGKHKAKIFLLAVFVAMVMFSYQIIYSTRTNKKLAEFENNFLKYKKRSSYDFCDTSLATRNLSEFFVCSASLPFLTGFKKYDYSSLDMFKKTLQYGVRFVYLEIYERKGQILVSSGNPIGSLLESQNALPFIDILSHISKYAFSQKSIDNYTDPFFMFLDIRGNDPLHEKTGALIDEYCRHLLYNKFNQNISRVNMCDLMRKLIVFSNKKIENITHMTTESSHLKVLGIHEIPTREILVSETDKPIIEIVSRSISFVKNKINIHDNSNFISLGVSKSAVVRILGSKNNERKNELLEIIQVSGKTLILNKDIEFVEEYQGEKVKLKFFEKGYKLRNLAEENKNNLTIVIPEFDFLKMNYNPADAFNVGAQFVCMNFQELDNNLSKYMKKFKEFSIRLKSKHLINYIPKPRVPNLNSRFPRIIDVDYPLVLDFKTLFPTMQLEPITYESLRVIKQKNTLVLSPVYRNDNSYFEVVDGLNGTFGSISLKHGRHYLTSSDACCYLSFQPTPKADHATFIPIKSLGSDKRNFSFLQIVDDQRYYLKHRQGFNPKTQLYSKRTSDYTLVARLSSESGFISIWLPVAQGGFKPYCQVITKGNDRPNFSSLILKGAVAMSSEMNLVYKDQEGWSIWRPVPKQGYVTMGTLFSRSHQMPSLAQYVTVGYNYTNQADLGEKLWDNGSASFWETGTKDYAIGAIGTKRPSEFSYPVYTVDLVPKNLEARVYIGRVPRDETDSACFKVHEEPSNVPKASKTYSDIVDSGESYQIKSLVSGKSLSLERSQWSDLEGEPIVLKDATEEDQYGNSFIIYPDGIVALKANNNYAMAFKDDKLVLTKRSEANHFFFFNNNMRMIEFEPEYLEQYVNEQLALVGRDEMTGWKIFQTPSYRCFREGNVVFLRKKVPRSQNVFFASKPDYTSQNNHLEEYIDRDNFTVYVQGTIKELGEEKIKLELSNNLGFVEVESNSPDIVLNSPIFSNEVNIGTKIIAKAGGLMTPGYTSENIKWEATIVSKVSNSQVMVMFSINSIEANMNKSALGRPRENKEILMTVKELVPLKPCFPCINI